MGEMERETIKKRVGDKLCDICFYRLEGTDRKCKMYPEGIPMKIIIKQDAPCEKFSTFEFF